MDKIWQEMYDAARKVLNDRKISDYVTAGGVSAAVLSSSGKIYTGVCIDTASTLGICAERNAIFNKQWLWIGSPIVATIVMFIGLFLLITGYNDYLAMKRGR